MAGVAGYFTLGGFHGAVESAGGYMMAKTVLDSFMRSGTAKTEALLTEALLKPELAKTLLMKASPENRPFIAQRLSSQLGTLGTVAAGSAAANENRRPSQPVGKFPTRTARPTAPVVLPGSLAVGGALRRAAR
jgi:hypothetical protein